MTPEQIVAALRKRFPNSHVCLRTEWNSYAIATDDPNKPSCRHAVYVAGIEPPWSVDFSSWSEIETYVNDLLANEILD